ncbi:hypothetical protein ASD74_06285 [Rhizobium sp. Root564]|nr:hypothetical protein ASD74_06285 [Rhizobium sp. Root564]
MIERPALPDWMLGRSDYGQNAKGPAEAATSPSHGQIHSPSQDIEMNKASDTTDVLKKKVSDEAVADAMRTLDGDIHALHHMSDITAESFDAIFGPGSRIEKSKEGVAFRITQHEFNQMAFLVNNVAERCHDLHKRFQSAWSGEKLA